MSKKELTRKLKETIKQLEDLQVILWSLIKEIERDEYRNALEK